MDILNAINRLFYDYSLNELRRMNENTSLPNMGNISYNSLLYLDLIYYKENCTVSYLSNVLHISKSGVTIKVNELIRQGLVNKTQSKTDRRVYYLSVSQEIKDEYSHTNKKLEQTIQLLGQQFSEKELDTFCRMLDLIRESYLEDPG